MQVLVVGDQPLADEVEAALAGARRGRAFLRLASDFEAAERSLRQREPDLIVGLLGDRPADLRAFAQTVRSLAPEAVLIGAQAGRGEPETSAEVLVEAIRSKLADVLERPLSSEALRDTLGALDDRAERGPKARSGRILAFHSTKGGVGKSTLSINTAVGLALRHPDQVLLIDCSLQLGVCASALDLEPTSSIATAARERDRLDPRMLREISELHPGTGLRLLSAPLDPVDASDVDDQAMARILALARRTFAYVVVDTLPIVDAIMLAIFDLADRIYLVNQGTVPDVIGAARLRTMLDQIEIPAERERIVLNRNTPPFPGLLGRDEVSRRIGREIDFEVPYDKRVLSALNLGEPRILSAGRRGWGRVLRALIDDAESIGNEPGPESASSLEERATTPDTAASPDESNPLNERNERNDLNERNGLGTEGGEPETPPIRGTGGWRRRFALVRGSGS